MSVNAEIGKDRLRQRLERSMAWTASGCWEWTQSRVGGYGNFAILGHKFSSHRVSYELYVGPIPPGFEIDHLCRNRACARPDHLEAVTGAENRRRAKAALTHCPRGHEYTQENTLRTTAGARYCRECKNVLARVAWHQAHPGRPKRVN